MRCPICTHETADDSLFCGNCGAKLSGFKKAEENTPAKEQPAESVNMASAGQETPLESTPTNESFTVHSEEQTPEPDRQSQQIGSVPYVQQPDFAVGFAPKKKSRVPFFAIIAVFLAVAIGALYFSGVFDGGPLESIAEATDKTMTSKSFDVNFKLTFEQKILKINGTVLFDPASESVEFYMEVYEPGEDEAIVTILKNNIILVDDGYVDTDDVSEFLDKFWDEYKNKSDLDWRDLLDTIGLGSDEVDFDKFEAAVDEFIKNLNDEDYINEKLGTFEKITKNGTTSYNFVFKPKDVSEELINVFGDSFKKIDKAKAEDNLYDALKNGFGSSFELNFKEKNGYLTGFNFESNDIEMEVQFSDFGKAEIDDSKFEKYDSYFKAK
jgi:hypothetical protein